MKVVFLEPVEGTAYPGDVKDVADGFARNYLLPRGLAVPANGSTLQRAESLAKSEQKRQEKLDVTAQGLLSKLEGLVLRFEEKVGEQGRLFGSVTVSHIADRLEAALGAEFDRHRVLLADPLRQLGRYDVRLRLSRNVEGTVAVEVVAEGAAEAPAAEAPAAEVAAEPAEEASEDELVAELGEMPEDDAAEIESTAKDG